MYHYVECHREYRMEIRGAAILQCLNYEPPLMLLLRVSCIETEKVIKSS